MTDKPKGGTARQTALALLDEALAATPHIARLEARDRAFARLLLVTMLRRLGQIDAALADCLDRPIKAKDMMLQHIRRLGAVQLLFLETPPHAAVSTALELAKGPRLAGQRGLLNAVLRRLSREGRDLVAAQDAARLNTPDWLWKPWCAAYGEVADRAGAEICGQPLWLASALEKIERAARGIDNRTAEGNPATAHMFIINPLHAHNMDGLFTTHPRTENRVQRLREMAAEMGQTVRRQPRPWG